MLRAGNPNWVKGVSANPKGRKKGTKDEAGLLLAALKNVEANPHNCKCNCPNIREHFARRAYQDDKVLIAFMKKIEPDLTYEQGDKAPSVINVNRIYLGENDTERGDNYASSVRSYRRQGESSPSDSATNPKVG